jgi:predicted ATP-grasp superfamily ATP-dependent carboligase
VDQKRAAELAAVRAIARAEQKALNATRSISIVDHVKLDLSKALMVIAFPGHGRAASVSAYYLIDVLKMKRLASISSARFPPMAVVRDGHPYPPIGIYSAPMVCGLDGRCNQVVVVTSEITPHPLVMEQLADALLNWAEEKRIKSFIALESLEVPEEEHAPGESHELQVYSVISSGAKKMARALKSEPLGDGLLSGFSGLFSAKAELTGRALACLIVEAHPGYTDARAAAQLVKVMSPLLPKLSLDTEPLYAKAGEIEEQLKHQVEAHELAFGKLSRESEAMFR